MRPRTLGLFALLCVLVAYASVWTAGFVYESHPAPVTLETLWRFEWYWQPRALSYWVMGQLHGVNAGAQHGISLGLHLLTGTLVGLLGVRLGLSRIAAVAAGSLFLVHPLAVETVAYVTSRTDQLAAIGVLTACILATGRWYAWLGIPLALGFGVLAKESAVVGLGLVPLVWAMRVPGWSAKTLTALGSLAFLPLGAWHYGGLSRMVNYLEGPGMTIAWWDWLLVQGTAALRLLTLAILPIGLTVDYDYDRIPLSTRVFACTALMAIALTLWRLTHTHPLIAFGLAFAILAILPRFIIQTPRSYLTEHHAYLSLAGLVLSAAAYWEQA